MLNPVKNYPQFSLLTFDFSYQAWYGKAISVPHKHLTIERQKHARRSGETNKKTQSSNFRGGDELGRGQGTAREPRRR